MLKETVLLLLMIFISMISRAQITEVKTDGSYARIYDDKGHYTGNSIYLSSNSSLAGYSNNYIVIKDGPYAKIYDCKGHYTGNSIYLSSSAGIKNVSASAILIKDGSYVKYYDFTGHYTGTSTYDPK